MKKNFQRLFLLVGLTFILFSCGDGKKALLTKKWKATEIDLSGTKLTGDQVNMIYQFNPDGSFFRTEDGKTEDGTYTLSKEGNKLTLNFKDQDLTAEKTIEKLTEDKLVLSGEEFSMQRTLTLTPVKK